MPDLLLELFTEEIPARMQKTAAADLRRLFTAAVNAVLPETGAAQTFVTPRRLTLAIEGIPAFTPEIRSVLRGPRVGAPQSALDGFIKSSGVTKEQIETRDTDKGSYHVAVILRRGRPTNEALVDVLKKCIDEFPWPKSMRFPAAGFRWVRPLTSVVALFDGHVLKLDLGAVPVGDETRGHRFLAGASFRVRDLADYRDQLKAAFVVLDAEERGGRIAAGLEHACKEVGVALKPDPGLLEEVTGLVEWPVVLKGRIDPEFMALPPEVLTTSMRAHQKYFACLDGGGRLAPHFLVVANMAAADGGAEIVAGNERVLRARLSDARFFWEQDHKVPLVVRLPKLAERVFHARLGSVLDKSARVMQLVEDLVAQIPGADPVKVLRAAELAKADLSTGMVGEFPELQGVMGRYYALGDGEPREVAEAIAEHYSPLGPNDRCPTAPDSVAVALADKIDTLVGFFAIDEKPTGSKDPFALRRAALGVIRLILENRLRLKLLTIFRRAHAIFGASGSDPTDDLLAFFADRLKVHLRERGVRHDLVAAIFAVGGEDDLLRLLARVDALAAFLASEDGANLLTAYRRAANIVRIEERKDGVAYEGKPDPQLFAQGEERVLGARLAEAEGASAAALRAEEFAQAMAALARLRGPVDEFFSKVTVNCDEAALRANRLRLLARIRDTLNAVADFSLIEG